MTSEDKTAMREWFDYNPESGEVIWLRHRGSRVPGNIAGSRQHDGYLLVTLHGQWYRAHHIAWLFVYGEWPDGQIDHINHNRSDNRIANLRLVTAAENRKNSKLQINCRFGIPGVTYRDRDKKWQAKIKAGGQYIYLGYHLNFFDACCARKAAEHKYGFHPNHGRTPKQDQITTNPELVEGK